jgi:F420H(2)-dependent quinone reductase
VTTHRSRFWATNHLANPVLRPLLRGRAGTRLGRHLAVLRYRGHRTGDEHELVVQYARDGDRVWIMPGQPEHKNWWRSLRRPTTVDVWLAGRHHRATAVAIEGRTRPNDVADALGDYLAQLPRARTALHVDGTTDLMTIAPSVVMVRVDVSPGGSQQAG